MIFCAARYAKFSHFLSLSTLIYSIKDFDSTRQHYMQCIAEWAGYLDSAIKVQSISPPSCLQWNIEHVKDQLDSLVREWKPHNFNLTKIEKPPFCIFRVCNIFTSIWLYYKLMNFQQAIQHEHHIFANFARASTPSDQFKTIVSSLVVGEHFIHSYHFRFQGWKVNSAIFLILITYSKHGNVSFLKTCTNVDIIDAMQVYLKVSCTS